MQILPIDWFPHNSHVEKGQEKIKTINKAPLLFGGKKQNKKKCQVERSGVTWRTQRYPKPGSMQAKIQINHLTLFGAAF
jgi:hypothetical protein